MAHNRRSLELTQAYRSRKAGIVARVERAARQAWPRIAELDTTTWPEFMARVVAAAQLEGLRATSGYLAAYLRSETGKATQVPVLSRDFINRSRDGRPLAEALTSPLIGVKAKLKQGQPPAVALAYGLNRALRMVGFEVSQAPRDALLDAIEHDERFTGFERNVAGTCAACEALSATGGPRFEVHPGCQCEPQPVVKGLTDRFPLPTGPALFAEKTREEQDAAVGPEAADAIRNGAPLQDFISHSKQATQDDFITQRPVEQVT